MYFNPLHGFYPTKCPTRRVFIAGFSFRFLPVSYEKSARKASFARLYHQADSALGFAKRLRVGHDYGIDLLVRHRGLIQAGIVTVTPDVN